MLSELSQVFLYAENDLMLTKAETFTKISCFIEISHGVRSRVPFQPLDNFDFSHPESWPEWCQRFHRYRIAT